MDIYNLESLGEMSFLYCNLNHLIVWNYRDFV